MVVTYVSFSVSSVLCVTNCLVWIVYLLNDNMVIGYSKNTYSIYLPSFYFEGPHLEQEIAFHFSDFGLSLHSQCCVA